ncbi:polyphosphate polymerase domain-containing protein [Brachybacterium sp. DNPG3]
MRLQRRLDAVPSVSLEEIGERAALMTRVDRKYLVPRATAAELLAGLDGGIRVLEIDGRRSFGYRSVYFDTLDFASYRAAATGRRRRWKVRRRDYLDTGASYLEVKTRTGRGESSKLRIGVSMTPVPSAQTLEALASPPAASVQDAYAGALASAPDGPLRGVALAFTRETLAAAGCDVPAVDLIPALYTAYDRSTLLVEDEDSRLTIDANLTWTSVSGTDRALPDQVVVETKSGRRPGLADRMLWASGHRPAKVSKYATGLALYDPALPSNKWHRTLGTLDLVPQARHASRMAGAQLPAAG